MTGTAASGCDARSLDDAPSFDPEPEIWTENLTALRAASPALAARIESAAWPSNWRCVRAMDGAITYRTEAADGPAAWIGGSAAPTIRAASLFVEVLRGDRNVAIPLLGGGAEVRWLLDRIASRRAVFAFENDDAATAAALRAHCFVRDLSDGRLILVDRRDPSADLLATLQARCGLLPPEQIVAIPAVPPEWLAAVRDACQRAATEIGARRSARMAELRATAARPVESTGQKASLALLAREAGPAAREMARGLAAAARSAGVECRLCEVRTPLDAHPLAACEALASFEPGLCVSFDSDVLPVDGASMRLRVFSSPVRGAVPTGGDDATPLLAASPQIAAELAHARDRAVRLFPWAADANLKPNDLVETVAPHIALVGDLPDSTPDASRIEQPTHRLLWEQVRKTTADLWETPEMARPESLLRNAEKAAGLSLGDDNLRRQFLRLISESLIPPVVLERIASALTDCGLPVSVIGAGWTVGRWQVNESMTMSQMMDADYAVQTPTAAIFLSVPDAFTPALLAAAARGWPLLLHSPGGLQRVEGLGDVLRHDEHYATFGDREGLRARLAEIRERPHVWRRRARRAAAHVRAHHSYTNRVTELLSLATRPVGGFA